MKRIVVLLLMILLIRLAGLAQGFEKPPAGKAIIHLVFGETLTGDDVHVYLEDSLIGRFIGNEYISLLVGPGYHNLKARTEDQALMEAEVAANRIYLVLLERSHGSNGSTIRFNPVKDGTPRFLQLKHLISANPPSQASRDGGMNGKDKTPDKAISTTWTSHLSKDMDVGRSEFKVPPISH